ncbi:MAG: cupin domain-containing protein [Pseudomonadota bacterium]
MNCVTRVAQAREAIVAAQAAGTSPYGLPAAILRQHGTMTVFLYEPRGVDGQPVHEQDEVYVIVSGTGTFAIGTDEDSLERTPFSAGDVIFTPAGAVHRFEDFSDDFSTWVVMYGPPGGERHSVN